MFKTAFSIAALLTAEPVPAAQDGGVVQQQLAEADQLMVGVATNTGNQGFGDLNDGDDVDLTLALRPGSEYIIVGVCDSDCSDLDMIATGGAGSTLDSDLETDDVPLLSFVADGTGRVTLSISMADCSDEPCGYGYRVYLAN